MAVGADEFVPIQSANDIIAARQAVRHWAGVQGFSLVEQTKLITAASELARNALEHGGGGEMRVETVAQGSRKGLRLTFKDDGPGIPDVEQAMKDGFSTAGGLGLGLSGAKRLVNEFQITSETGKGTTVVVTRWKM